MNDKYFSRDNLELIIGGLKVGMTPDWNEDDKNEFGYIRNKPFYTDGDIVHQLDEKYIPDSIARVEDIDSLKMNVNNPVGTGSFSMNRKQPTIIGEYSHAEGLEATASGYASHAEGDSTVASGNFSHAEGWSTTASGEYSHAEGCSTVASGNFSHSEGLNTTASGHHSHAEGCSTKANGEDAHAEGSHTISNSNAQHVQGKCNIIDTSGKYAHIVGNGDSISVRSNAHTLDWNGVGWFQGGLQVGGVAQDGEGVGYVPAVPAGVQVGQTIVVKSVDENGKPTEWECVDAQPDWNQNDSTKPDYVKNRTHYTETVGIELIPRTTHTFGVGPLGRYSTTTVDFVEGNTYTVMWDGQEYECICYQTGNGLAIGRSTFIGVEGFDNGEPFVIDSNISAGATIIMAPEAGEHTFSVLEKVEKVYKLDAKYLPTAAAVADVTATPTADEFNALLAALRDAGYLAT